MKKIFLLSIMFLITSSCFGLFVDPSGNVISAPNVDEDGNQIVRFQSRAVGWDWLQLYTSAAYTITVTSNPAQSTHTITGMYVQYASSFSLICTNDLASTTNYFDITKSTSDCYFDIVNRINETNNFTATISQGSYGLDLATGTAAVRNSQDGKSDGVQYTATGKLVTFSTGSANAITVYKQASQYLAYRQAPSTGKSHIIGWVDGNPTLATTGTGNITVYEGIVSSSCATQKNVPITITATAIRSGVSYADPFNITGTEGYAFEYIMYGSTWITGGSLGAGGRTK